MNITGDSLLVQTVLPENFIIQRIKKSSSDAVRKVRKVISPMHWSFASVMAEILPYAIESISPDDAYCEVRIPKLVERSNKMENRESLSNALDIWVFQRMIINDTEYAVPAIRFSKHAIAIIDYKLEDVTIEQVIHEYRFWRKGNEMDGKRFMDLEPLIELTLLTYIRDGYAIYCATAFEQHGNRYYRIAAVKDDVFAEMTLYMDEYHRMKTRSNSEIGTFTC